jgi:hypothetical protein
LKRCQYQKSDNIEAFELKLSKHDPNDIVNEKYYVSGSSFIHFGKYSDPETQRLAVSARIHRQYIIDSMNGEKAERKS